MPVPTPSTDAPTRTLLRDVVSDQIRREILRGQFEPGERLNDDSLIEWLGVSRTPIREALARLAGEGLVEMVANRPAQVPQRSATAYEGAAEYMHMIRAFILDHLDRVPERSRIAAQIRMETLVAGLEAHDRATQVRFNEQFGELAALVDNPLVLDAERRVRGQAQFHLQHPDSEINWANLLQHADALVSYPAS